MNKAQRFINAEFDYISDNVPDSSMVFKPNIVINHGLAKTRHISISWEQLEHIKQYLIESEKGK